MQTSPGLTSALWIPTRAQGMLRLAEFAPRAGRQYAAQRNYDRGPGDRSNVSVLSPYVRMRLVTETEVLAAVLARHAPSAAEKFVSEVFWRTYWKGWLESHPDAWTRYRDNLDGALARMAGQAELRAAYMAAVTGRTGIDAFDAWAVELAAVNYLHNHARMWFASIWIFTLQLPWELGADFFMRHLLDGDPASNTLSWRWVAGLQTRGKTYTATRDNIRRYTGDRFELSRPLLRAAPALDEPPLPQSPVPPLPAPRADGRGPEPTLFVIHDDDLHGDRGDLPLGMCAVAAIDAVAGRSPQVLAPAVLAFTRAAASESTARIATAARVPDLGLLAGDCGAVADVAALTRRIVTAARDCGARRVVAAFAPVGPVRELLDRIGPALEAAGLAYAEIGRRYDAVSWPAATRGFFNLRASIPTILTELGIVTG
jgi:deoxyribodipyrimidine photo-lyase